MLRQCCTDSNQNRMLLTQELEFVEQRIDHQRSDHDHSEENQDRGKPEVQPPASRASPHYGKQDQHKNDTKCCAQELSFGPIPEPRAPALNRLLVVQGKRVPVNAHGQFQNAEGQEKQRDEDQSLNPFLVAGTFGDVAKLGRPAQPQDQKKEKSAKKIRDEVQSVARPRVRHRLPLAFLRKRVFFGPRLLWSL